MWSGRNATRLRAGQANPAHMSSYHAFSGRYGLWPVWRSVKKFLVLGQTFCSRLIYKWVWFFTYFMGTCSRNTNKILFFSISNGCALTKAYSQFWQTAACLSFRTNTGYSEWIDCTVNIAFDMHGSLAGQCVVWHNGHVRFIWPDADEIRRNRRFTAPRRSSSRLTNVEQRTQAELPAKFGRIFCFIHARDGLCKLISVNPFWRAVLGSCFNVCIESKL